MKSLLTTMIFCVLFPLGSWGNISVVPKEKNQALEEEKNQAFRAVVASYAQKHHHYIDGWWTDDLDRDSQLERIAILCPVLGNDPDQREIYVIEKGAPQPIYWVLSFETDGRTQVGCGEEKNTSYRPVWKQKHTGVIEWREGNHGGYEELKIAIRQGQLVIVKRETLDDVRGNRKPVKVDYDKLTKRTGSFRYPLVAKEGQFELSSF